MRRSVRWVMLLLCVAFLVKDVFGEATGWSVAGFFACLGIWYWLTWRRQRELDAPRPR